MAKVIIAIIEYQCWKALSDALLLIPSKDTQFMLSFFKKHVNKLFLIAFSVFIYDIIMMSLSILLKNNNIGNLVSLSPLVLKMPVPQSPPILLFCLYFIFDAIAITVSTGVNLSNRIWYVRFLSALATIYFVFHFFIHSDKDGN